MDQVIPMVREGLVLLWWWVQDNDVAALSAAFALVSSSWLVSWIVQHWKRRYNVDLRTKGKQAILKFLGFLSAVVALADWWILNIPAPLLLWLGAWGSAIMTGATLIHRFHTSKQYDRLTGWLYYIATRTIATRDAKYGTDDPPAPPPSGPSFK